MTIKARVRRLWRRLKVTLRRLSKRLDKWPLVALCVPVVLVTSAAYVAMALAVVAVAGSVAVIAASVIRRVVMYLLGGDHL